MSVDRPGSQGEHALQERFGTFKRAAAFYDKQMLDHVNPLMREYLKRQEMVFLATSDANGACDASFRAGPPGFVRVIDDHTIMYPEYRGNGVMATLGNIAENSHIGMLFVDFLHSGVGLHVNGKAHIVEHQAVVAFTTLLKRVAGIQALHDIVADKKKTPERWVLVDVVEAYIHCSKHIPILAHLPGNAGHAPPSGDHFRAKDEPRRWVAAEADRPLHEVDGDLPRADPGPVAPAVAGIEAFLDYAETEMMTSVSGGQLQAAADDLSLLLPPAWDRAAPR